MDAEKAEEQLLAQFGGNTAASEVIADPWDLSAGARACSPLSLPSIERLMREGFGDETMRGDLAQSD